MTSAGQLLGAIHYTSRHITRLLHISTSPRAWRRDAARRGSFVTHPWPRCSPRTGHTWLLSSARQWSTDMQAMFGAMESITVCSNSEKTVTVEILVQVLKTPVACHWKKCFDAWLVKYLNPITKGGGTLCPPLRFFAYNPIRRGLGVAQIADFSCI